MSTSIEFERSKARFGFLRIVCAALAAISVSGCATLIRGPNADFHIVTEPPGAVVETDLQIPKWDQSNPEYFACEATPCAFEVSRRSNFVVSVTLDGYHPATVNITSGLGKRGPQSSGAGAVSGATGAYIVSYALISSTATALSTVATAGLSTSAASAGAGSAAATGAAGVGLLFLGVDVISGAMLDVRPNPLVLILVPEDQPLPEPGTEMIDTEEALETAVSATKQEDTNQNALGLEDLRNGKNGA